MTRYYKYIQLKIIRITNLHSKENYTKQKIHPNNIQRIKKLKIKKKRKKNIGAQDDYSKFKNLNL